VSATPARGGSRLVAAHALMRVLDQGQSLDAVLDTLLADVEQSRDRALARRLCHGVLRDWPALNHLLARLLTKAPARRDRVVHFLLAIALSELRDGREPDHAIVHSAVEAVRAVGLGRLTGLANAVLRSFQRQQESLESELVENPVLRFGYPGWLIEKIRSDWPEDWENILINGNQAPPLCLRVNRRHWTREQARQALVDAGHASRAPDFLPDGLLLEQRAAIAGLPGFLQGGLSVQDGAAQLAVEYLDLENGLRVLDACAAPGGKSAHILERAEVELTVLEIDEQRMERVGENLERLGLSARLVVGDATRPDQWWDGQPFDRILVDAPCTATGVIRRHPDIRWLRQPADIDAMVAVQATMLDRLWPLLSPGGILVYATCSILKAENQRQGQTLLERHEELQVIDHENLPGRACSPGRQLLPGDLDLDGFYHLAVRRLPA
jgi:16S rRNA (cytosine967-C5)-methyltransferase